MVNKAILALGVTGVGVATYLILDHENILPWANNAGKQWIWERITPQATARAVAVPAVFRPQPKPPQVQPLGMIGPSAQDATAVIAVGKYRITSSQVPYQRRSDGANVIGSFGGY